MMDQSAKLFTQARNKMSNLKNISNTMGIWLSGYIDITPTVPW